MGNGKVDVIGINHSEQEIKPCLFSDGDHGYVYCSEPTFSKELISFVEGRKVGLEVVPQDSHVRLMEQFYFPMGKSIMGEDRLSLYNPRAFDGFYTLSDLCGETVALDSPEMLSRLIKISRQYDVSESFAFSEKEGGRPANPDHFFLLYDEGDVFEDGAFTDDMSAEEAYEILCQRAEEFKADGMPFLRSFMFKTLAQRITSYDRDSYMLEKVLASDVDTAVVGFWHALQWKIKGYDFNFLMEDSFNGLQLQSLDENSMVAYDSLEDELLDWNLSFLDVRREKPILQGLRHSCIPRSYFEVYASENGYVMKSFEGTRPVCFDLSGSRVGVEVLDTDESYSFDREHSFYIGDDGVLFNSSLNPFHFMRRVYKSSIVGDHLKMAPMDPIYTLKNPLPVEVEHMLKHCSWEEDVPF